MNTPSSKKALIAAAASAVLVLGALLYWRATTHVAPEDVSAFLDSTVGTGRVRFTVTKLEAMGQDDAGRRIAVTAKAWPVQPLYAKADTADFLQATFQLDQDSTAEARKLLADKATAKNTHLTAGRPLPADPFQAAILQATAPADASFGYSGVVGVHREGSHWAFSLISGNFDGTGPQGDPRSTFASPSYVAGDAGDEAHLRAAVADFQAFAGRVAEVHSAVERARTAVVDARRNAFLARIAPGRLFSGTASEAGEQNGTPIFLEITALSGNDVTAVLRNEGSWHNARIFQGTWNADDGFQQTTLTLFSPAAQAVHNAGPILENTQNWSFDLNVDASGRMTEQNRNFQYRLQPVPPAQAAAIRSRLEAEFEQAEAATEPGSLYQGAATSRSSGQSLPILLRFATKSEDGRTFEATIESTTRSWRRPLHGSIIDNARRSRGTPIHLATATAEAALDAPPDSALGDQDDLEISLAAADGALSGGDANFTYQFARAEETDLSRLAAGRAERARHFMGVLRDGIAYDGTLREDQGFITHARLEITRVDRKTGAVTASIHSLARSKVYREFTGTCDPAGGALALNAASRGSFGEDGSFDIPFLTSASASAVHLELTGNSLKGRIEGDPHWTMEFPAGIFLSATTEGAEANSPPANGSVFPEFPKAPGAYLLSHGSWAAMPRNNGHVVVETITKKSDLSLPSNIVGAVDMGVRQLANLKDKTKVSYLEFDGKEARPESSGQTMLILFVGPTPAGKPPFELAPTELQKKDGIRRIEVATAPGAEVRLGEQRLAAYVRGAGTGYTLFTTTSALSAGTYAFNADAPYELTQE
jgi:hypothetical protein